MDDVAPAGRHDDDSGRGGHDGVDGGDESEDETTTLRPAGSKEYNTSHNIIYNII